MTMTMGMLYVKGKNNNPALSFRSELHSSKGHLAFTLEYSGYVYMDTFCLNRNEIIPIDESEYSVYMNAKL